MEIRKRINGKNISNVDFFQVLEHGEKVGYAYIYFNNMSKPIKVNEKEAVRYLEAAAKAHGIDKDDATALDQLEKQKIFKLSNANDALDRYERTMGKQQQDEEDIIKKTKQKLNSKGVKIGAFAVALSVLLGIGSCQSGKKVPEGNVKASGVTSTQADHSNFASLLAQLKEGPKKDAMSAVQGNLKMFNDTLSGNIMKEGEDKRLAHSWEENMASYLAFNQFTEEELFQIFDTYKINADDLYDQLKLSNMKEMLYYARATESSGRAMLIGSEEGKAFFNGYETLVLRYNKATAKEEKIELAKQFYAKVRADFPIEDQDKEGFIHTEKGYEDYAYAVTPMISAMEVMTRNIGVSLTDKEVAYFNELGMCNFAQEKLENYENDLTSRQNIEIAKEELRSESQLEAAVSSDGEVYIVEKISYQELKEAGIASIDHYDLSAEKNDVGMIAGYWEDATLDTLKKQVSDKTESEQISSTSSSSYRKTLTESDLKKESPAIQQEAQKQKDVINSQIEQENKAAKAESDRKKQELEKQIEEEKKELEKEIEEDNAWMNDPGNEEVPGRPNVSIDDSYLDENGNPEFDGPIYDEDGNIISWMPNPNANARSISEESLNIEVSSDEETTQTSRKSLLKEVADQAVELAPIDDPIVITDPKPPIVTYGGISFAQTESGLYAPASVSDIEEYVDALANPEASFNQTSGIVLTK